MKMVYCVWEDAAVIDEGPWADRLSAKPSTATIFHQIGFLHELTPEAVVLTEVMGETQMGPRSRIPIGMVRSLTELESTGPVKIPKQRKARQ